MSASIIQRKAGFATVTGSGGVAVTLDNPISEDSIIVISAALVQTNGSGVSAPTVQVQDDFTNTYSPSAYTSSGNGLFCNAYQISVIPQAGAQIYTLSFTAPAGQASYTFLAGLCIYELSGASSFATNESASQSLTAGLHKISDLAATISGLSGGTYGNFLPSIGAFTFSSSITDAQAVAAGSGWTLDGRAAASGTFGPMAIVFQNQLVGPAANPAAAFSGDGNATENDGTILVAAYSLTSAIPGGGGGGGGVTGGPVFLGSVRVVGSAPAGRSNPFLGTVKVVGSAPAGAPYLGTVVLDTPSGSQTNPSLGEVCIVESAPAGAADPFLGSVAEG